MTANAYYVDLSEEEEDTCIENCVSYSSDSDDDEALESSVPDWKNVREGTDNL